MLGQALIRLYHQHYKLHFLGRNKLLGEQIEKQYGAIFHQVDLADIDALKTCCLEMDVVVHCAALSSPWGKPEDFKASNIIGTEHILSASQQAGVKRFVHISTPSLYFYFKSQTAIKESDKLPLLFCNEYARTKAEAEQRVLNSALDTIILRPRGIFGPQDRAIVPRLLRFIKNKKLFLPSSRNPLVDLTYVDNVADAIILSVNAPSMTGAIFNITNGQPKNIQSMLSALLAQLAPNTKIVGLNYHAISGLVKVNQWVYQYLLNHKEPRLTDYSAALLHYDQTLDISKAQSVLGYQPKISIEEGIKRYAIWHKNPTI